MLQEVVIMHWACAKITASSAMSDEDLLKILVEKVITYKLISLFSNNFECYVLAFF